MTKIRNEEMAHRYEQLITYCLGRVTKASLKSAKQNKLNHKISGFARL